MKVFTTRLQVEILVQIRAESKDGLTVGDLTEFVKPGDTFLGKPYTWWAELPDGEHEIKQGPAEFNQIRI
jgi:hypothetical protein